LLSVNLTTGAGLCPKGPRCNARATHGEPKEFGACRYADVLRLVLRTQPRSSVRQVLECGSPL